MSIARKILSNTVAQVLGKVATAILGLAVVKMATQYLGTEGYGMYTSVYEILALFSIAADLGLFTIAVKEMSENEDDIENIIGNILSLRTILVFAVMAVGATSIFFVQGLRGSLIPVGVALASITVIITILNGTITSVLQTKLRMQQASFAVVLGKGLSVGLMVYIIYFGFPEDSSTGFFFLFIAGIIGNLLMIFTTRHYVRKITRLKYRFDFKLWKELIWKTLPYGLALILNTVYFRIDSLLILSLRGAEEVGIYGVAMRILEHFTVIPLYFMNSILPVMTKSIKEKNTQYKQIISHSFNFLAALSVPMVIGAFILAYPIIFIVSSPDFLSRLPEGFYGSDIALQLLIFALLFQFLNILFAFILISVNQQTKLLYVNAICVVINIATNFIFIPVYGFRGAAVTSVFSELFILIATYFLAKKYLDFSINLSSFFKIIFSGSVMGLVVYYLQVPSYNLVENYNVLLLIPVGMVVYVSMLFLTKTIDKNMIQLIKKGR